MREPYKGANGKWILFDGVAKKIFETKGEAEIMARKLEFASKVQSLATDMASIMESAPDLYQLYFDCEYNSGGANEIIDADIASLGFTKTQLTNMITCIENFNKFIAGTTPANAAYRISINSLRK